MGMAEEIDKTLVEYIENENLMGNIAELDEVLCNLVDNNKSDEGSLRRVVLCIYQLLDGHNKWQVKFGTKVFHKLVALLAKGQSRTTTALILSCIKIYVRKFPKQQGQYLIEELWCLSTSNEQQPNAALILMHMFDCFVGVIDSFLYAKELHEVIRQLLVSDLLEERKAAHRIMRQLLAAIEVSKDDTRLNALGWSDKQQFIHNWSIYIAMWEQLELAPTAVELDSLKELQHNKNSWWQVWLNLLQKTLLAHDNISIIRKTLYYFMENYNFAELNESLQKQFLLAANNVELYNVDVFNLWAKSNKELSHELAFVINPKYTRSFLKDAKVKFLEVLVTIEWKPVPLHFWLIRLTSEKPKRPRISKELLMRLAAVVRQVPNRKIRKILRCRLFRNFNKSINILNLPEYIAFCEALYSIEDGYYNHYNFWFKLKSTASLGDVMLSVTKRFYQIMSNRFKRYKYDDTIICPKYLNDMLGNTLERLAKLPKERHGWLRFLIVFDVEHTDLIIEFCRDQYDLDLVRLSTASLSLSEFCTEIAEKLVWQPEEEADFIRTKCVDLYVEQRLKQWSDLRELGLNPIELLSMGTCSTFAVLIKLLENHDSRLSSDVLPAMIETLKKTSLWRNDICGFFVRLVFSYANRNLTDSEIESLTYDMLNVDRTHSVLTMEVARLAKFNKATLIRGLLHGEPTSGIERIEEAYEDCFANNNVPNILRLRISFKFSTELYVDKSVYDELLRINNELTRRRPRYHENSKVHRLKMRIAIALFEIHYQMRWPYWTDELWTALLTDYDHENIRCLYELLIVTFAPDLETLLEKLRVAAHYTANQQVSLMSVVFLYCMFNWSKVDKTQLVVVLELLLPLTTSADYQTRLHAQLFSYCLIVKAEENNVQLPHGANTKQAMIDACGTQLQDYLLLPRFKMVECYKQESTCVNDTILFLTKAPFDECGYWFLHDILDTNYHQDFDNARKAYLQHAASTPPTYIAAADDINLDFGAYESNMRPIEEILFGSSVAKTQLDTHSEIFVVASLVDTLANLGGIARTCGVLGIKNLVMDSKMHVAKGDFQNLSMTAEKSLNILEVKPAALAEFLIQKQIEGFKIVGAEQTACSVSFVDFKFPPKCVLLLGHEKHGIPADLLGFLDYAVEIPQFGLVRSLNVHVTGALLMWEYCKQQLIVKS